MWRADLLGTDDARPDKLGIIFDSVLDDDLGLIIHAKEIVAGSIDKVERLIGPMAKQCLVYLSYCDGRENNVMGPFHMAMKLSEFLESKNVAFETR